MWVCLAGQWLWGIHISASPPRGRASHHLEVGPMPLYESHYRSLRSLISLDPTIFVTLAIPCHCQHGGLVRLAVLTFRCGELRSRRWFVWCVLVSPAPTNVSSATATCPPGCTEVRPAANNYMTMPRWMQLHACCGGRQFERSSSSSSLSRSSSSCSSRVNNSRTAAAEQQQSSSITAEPQMRTSRGGEGELYVWRGGGEGKRREGREGMRMVKGRVNPSVDPSTY